MFSHLAKKGKQLAILTLLMGILVMPVSPLIAEEITNASIIAPVETSQAVVIPVVDTPVDPAPTEVPTVPCPPSTNDDPIIAPATTTPDMVIDEVVASTTSPIIDNSNGEIITAPDLPVVKDDPAENNFTTLSDGVEPNPDLPVSDPVQSDESNFQTLVAEPTEIPDGLAISDENPFGEVIDMSTLAISEEGNVETVSEVIDDPWAVGNENSFTTLIQPVDTVTISNERSFNTLTAPVDTLAVSGENSFVTEAIVNDPVISREGNFTTLTPIIDTLAISAEYNFSTLTTLVDPLAISGERNFTTLPGGQPIEIAVSDERSFVTQNVVPTDTLTISAEQSFTTSTPPTPRPWAMSDEFSFTTLNLTNDRLAISAEQSFTTSTPPTPRPWAVSDENSFTTAGSPIIIDPAISDENSFTTSSQDNPPVEPPHHHHGGGGSSGGTVLGEQVYRCPILLNKFIKFGEANDRREVIKLQAFLKVYEGFSNLKITGTYDRATYNAVKVFQSRYLRDVLTPWGIDFSTGWVYITTRRAINNIYCGRDTANNLHFRDQVIYEYYQATGEEWGAPISEPEEGYYIVPTSTPTTTPSIIRPNIFLAGVGELLNFIGDNFCWLLNLLLLLLIFFLLWLLWQTGLDDENEKNDDILSEEPGIIPVIDPADEEELAKLAEEDEAKLEKLDNNPWQEAILLGPEIIEEKEEEESSIDISS